MLAEYELNRERNEELFVLGGVDNVCPVHFHRKVELLYVESGEKRIFGSGKEISLGENSVYFANSYEMHGYYPSEGGRQIVVVFPNGMLKDYYDEFGSVMPAGCVVDDAEFCKNLLFPHFRALLDGTPNGLLAQGHCDMLLGLIMHKLGTQAGTRDRQSFVDALLAYINENYAEDITLEGMAEHFGYSKYYFSRMFNAALGTSITDYVSSVRLMRALDMLRRTGCTVSDAAFSCGFSSLPTFYRALKRNYDYKSVKDLIQPQATPATKEEI